MGKFEQTWMPRIFGGALDLPSSVWLTKRQQIIGPQHAAQTSHFQFLSSLQLLG